MADYVAGRADPGELQGWDGLLDEASGRGTLFHRMAVLRAIARESGTSLVPLVARRDGRPAALFPVFESRRAGMRMLFSPPPGCALASLGPVVLGTQSSQSERESEWFALADAFYAFIRDTLSPHLERYAFGDDVGDLRPWQWQGYSAAPRYSYNIPLAGRTPDEIFAGFKGQLRTDVRRAGKYPELSVRDGGAEMLAELVRLTRERYRDQGIAWSPSDAYFSEVCGAADGGVVVKAAFVGDRMVAGLGLVVERDRVRHWIGGVIPKENFIGVNELLHWEAIQQHHAAGRAGYEMVGANTRHLCRHKSRYNPTLEVYHQVERETPLGRIGGALASGALRGLARRVYRAAAGRGA